jgi:hypothetical protein
MPPHVLPKSAGCIEAGRSQVNEARLRNLRPPVIVLAMSAARHPVLACLLAFALALLPLHGLSAMTVAQPAVAADIGDCHGQKAPDGDAAQCANCSACHAVQAEPVRVLPEQGHAATPTATLPPTLHGRVLQPDLHPPLA